jgi:hypothetical protein
MLETAPPTAVEILEAGPISPGGGLHEDDDLGTDEMWHATMSADVLASKAMTAGDGTGSATGAPPMAPDPSLTDTVGGMVLGDTTQARVLQRRAPPPAATVEVEEIPQGPPPPLSLFAK